MGLFTTEGLVMALLLGAGFAALFYRWFHFQHRHSWGAPDDWGHSYVVPLISGYLIWQRRREIAALPARRFWPALAPFILGIGAYFFFVATRFTGGHMIQGWAMLLTLMSLVLLMLGPRLFAPLFLPLAYLVFGITISEAVMIKLTAPLQVIASQGAYAILSVIGAGAGFGVELSGTVIEMGTAGGRIPLNVAEQCAGMRTVVAFFALAGATALLGCRHWWQRIALLLLAAPVATAVNVGRVAVLGLLSLADPNLSTGGAHMLVGQLLLIPGLLLFLLVLWTLKKIVRDDPGAAPA